MTYYSIEILNWFHYYLYISDPDETLLDCNFKLVSLFTVIIQTMLK